MKPGDLRRFRDGEHTGLGAPVRWEGATFMVLAVDDSPLRNRAVDILLDGEIEEGLGYFWVEDSSEVISESQ